MTESVNYSGTMHSISDVLSSDEPALNFKLRCDICVHAIGAAHPEHCSESVTLIGIITHLGPLLLLALHDLDQEVPEPLTLVVQLHYGHVNVYAKQLSHY